MLTPVIRAMIASGCTPQQILAAVEAHEVEVMAADEARRAKKRAGNAERQRRRRSNAGHAESRVTERDERDMPASIKHALRRATRAAQNKTLPEETKEESQEGKGVQGETIATVQTPTVTPTLTKPKRIRTSTGAHRLPDDWQLTDDLRNYANQHGVDPDQCAEDMRNWALAKGVMRQRWDMQFQGHVRRDEKRHAEQNRSKNPAAARLLRKLEEKSNGKHPHNVVPIRPAEASQPLLTGPARSAP